MQDKKFVVVASYFNPIEANIAKGNLENHYIEVELENETVINATGFSYLFGGVKLLVAEEDAEKARDILERASGK